MVKVDSEIMDTSDGSIYEETQNGKEINRTLVRKTDTGIVEEMIDEAGNVIQSIKDNPASQTQPSNQWVIYTKGITPGPHLPMFIPQWLANYYDTIIDSYGTEKTR